MRLAKRIAGGAMIAIPVIAMVVAMAADGGWFMTIVVLGAALIGAALMIGGIFLITSEDDS